MLGLDTFACFFSRRYGHLVVLYVRVVLFWLKYMHIKRIGIFSHVMPIFIYAKHSNTCSIEIKSYIYKEEDTNIQNGTNIIQEISWQLGYWFRRIQFLLTHCFKYKMIAVFEIFVMNKNKRAIMARYRSPGLILIEILEIDWIFFSNL